MQALYCSIIGLHSDCAGSSDLEKSMQSSRAAFSVLHTQQGYLLDQYPVVIPARTREQSSTLGFSDASDDDADVGEGDVAAKRPAVSDD